MCPGGRRKYLDPQTIRSKPFLKTPSVRGKEILFVSRPIAGAEVPIRTAVGTGGRDPDGHKRRTDSTCCACAVPTGLHPAAPSVGGLLLHPTESPGLWGRGGTKMGTYSSSHFAQPLTPVSPIMPLSLSLHTQPNAHTSGSAAVFPRATNPSCPSTDSPPPLSQHPRAKINHTHTHLRLTHIVEVAISAPSSLVSPASLSRPVLSFACLFFHSSKVVCFPVTQGTIALSRLSRRAEELIPHPISTTI